MKQAAEKTYRLAIAAPGIDGAARGSASLKEFFGSWLDSIAPELSKSPVKSAPRRLGFKHSISANEMVRVNRATVREGTTHRHWPPDVVAQFLTAEVITRQNKQD